MSATNQSDALNQAAITAASAPELSTPQIAAKFNRIVRRAQAAILWERLWPKTVPVLGTGALFMSASWAGLWGVLPPEGKIAGVLLFSAAALAAPFLVKSGSLRVTRSEAIRRIDKNHGEERRHAQTLNDRLNESYPEDAQELWKLHVKNTWEKSQDKLKAGKPSPGMNRRDPFSIRYALIAATIITGAIAGDQRFERVSEAFNWSAPVAPIPRLEVRAWVNPPELINRRPTPLQDRGPRSAEEAAQDKINVHQSSLLTIVVAGTEARVTINGETVPLKQTIGTAEGLAEGRQGYQYEVTLPPGEIHVKVENGPDWVFDVPRDHAPQVDVNTVRTVKDNEPGAPPRLQIECSAEDDHGVKEGEVIIRQPGNDNDEGATPLPSSTLGPIPLPRGSICAP